MRATTESSPSNIQLKYRQVRCKICYGTGRDSTSSATGVRCIKCDGTGWRLFPKGLSEKCPYCSGRGKHYRTSSAGSICQDCDGFGEIKLL